MARESMKDKITKNIFIKKSNIAKTKTEINILIKIIEQLKKISNLNQSIAATSCSEMNSTASIYDDINQNNIGIQYVSNKTAKLPNKDNLKTFDEKKQNPLLKPNCESTNGIINMQDISNQAICKVAEQNSKIGDQLPIANKVVLYSNNFNNGNLLANNFDKRGIVPKIQATPGSDQRDFDLNTYYYSLQNSELNFNNNLKNGSEHSLQKLDCNNISLKVPRFTTEVSQRHIFTGCSPPFYKKNFNVNTRNEVLFNLNQPGFQFYNSSVKREQNNSDHREFVVYSSRDSNHNSNNASKQAFQDTQLYDNGSIARNINNELYQSDNDCTPLPRQQEYFSNKQNLNQVTSCAYQPDFDFINSLTVNGEQNCDHHKNTLFILNKPVQVKNVATEEEWHIPEEDYVKNSWVNVSNKTAVSENTDNVKIFTTEPNQTHLASITSKGIDELDFDDIINTGAYLNDKLQQVLSVNNWRNDGLVFNTGAGEPGTIA